MTNNSRLMNNISHEKIHINKLQINPFKGKVVVKMIEKHQGLWTNLFDKSFYLRILKQQNSGVIVAFGYIMWYI